MRGSRLAVASCLLAGLLATLACSFELGLSSPTQTPQPTNTPYPTPTPNPTNTAEPAATRRPSPTSTPEPPSCVSPDTITASDKGMLIEICGLVVAEGNRDCPDCPYGAYSYASFEGGFNVISYEWDLQNLQGYCTDVIDTVELFGGKPVFIMDKAEGYGDYFFECE